MEQAGRGLDVKQSPGEVLGGVGHSTAERRGRLGGGVSWARTARSRWESWSHGALRFPAAKPTNWVEGTQAVLRAKKGQDDKVLVATCTSANGKPPSVVSWETRLKGEAEYQEIRNPNGTVTVISRYRLVPSREAHQQSLACVVNYHMDRFRESLTLNVQCEQGGCGPVSRGGRHCPLPAPQPHQPSLLLGFSLLLLSPPSFSHPLSLPLRPCSWGCFGLPPPFPHLLPWLICPSSVSLLLLP